MLISFVIARARNGVIGVDGKLPWHLAADLRHFKAVTMGKPIIMGRKTWESLPKRPLPGRPNIVVTRDPTFEAVGAQVATSLDAALLFARDHLAQQPENSEGEICVVGGAEIYAAFADRVRRLHLTEVDLAPVGDAYFTGLPPGQWQETSRHHFAASDGTPAYDFVEYNKDTGS